MYTVTITVVDILGRKPRISEPALAGCLLRGAGTADPWLKHQARRDFEVYLKEPS